MKRRPSFLLGETPLDSDGKPSGQDRSKQRPRPVRSDDHHVPKPLPPVVVPSLIIVKSEPEKKVMIVDDQTAIEKEPIQSDDTSEDFLGQLADRFAGFVTPSVTSEMNATRPSTPLNVIHNIQSQIVLPPLSCAPEVRLTRPYKPFGRRIANAMRDYPDMIQFIPWNQLTETQKFVIHANSGNRPQLRIRYQHSEFSNTFFNVDTFRRNSTYYGFNRTSITASNAGGPCIFLSHPNVNEPDDLALLSRIPQNLRVKPLKHIINK